MTTLMFALAMQYVIATKAGLVNNVQGLTNVKANSIVQPATPIRTGPDGFVEILLTPGSYLRLGPSSAAVLDSVDLANVAVQVTAGEAVVEVVEIDGKFPMHITTGATTVEIGDAGVFRFKDGTVTVVEGKLKTAGEPKITYKKGWDVSFTQNYRARKVSDTQPSALDSFSEQRSALLSRANLSLSAGVQRSVLASYAGANPFWLWSPILGACTYIPMRSIRSPYGYQYAGLTGVSYGGVAGNNMNNVPNGTNANNNSNPAPVNSSNGSFNSGGERTISPPAGERVTPREYQINKAPSAGAQQPPPN